VGLEDPSRNGDGGGELEVGEAGELILDEVVDNRVGRLEAVLAVSLEIAGVAGEELEIGKQLLHLLATDGDLLGGGETEVLKEEGPPQAEPQCLALEPPDSEHH